MKINPVLKLILICQFIYLSFAAYAQGNNESYYLPDINYNKEIPSPGEFFGFGVGEWHLDPSQVRAYMMHLSRLSERVEYYEYGKSHEQKPLFVLMISNPVHINNREKIKESHKKLAEQPENFKSIPADLPAVLYQGYTIHGNEPSGMNAAVLVAYYLAAGEGAAIEETLSNIFILLDPCLNPDGATRFSTWVNSHRHSNLVSDPADREFNEVWPGGRYNHYWFDMNRDWLPLVQPESQGRVKLFQEWRPNVLTDHHEMGTNSTFFFQPGIPSSTNPNTPHINQELTEEMGTYHAAALDSIGSRYFTKASFDDFYYGKGSTYPDAQGAVGILFEQASSRGHIQESVNGPLSFPFTIRNQVVTSLSTHKAIVRMKSRLMEYKRDFNKIAIQNMTKTAGKSYIFTDNDQTRLNKFLELLLAHNIEVYTSNKDFSAEGQLFKKDLSYIVPVNQKQPVLAATMFEKVTQFKDSSFYDVSGWTVAAAYNLRYAEYSGPASASDKRITAINLKNGKVIGNKTNAYAYIANATQHNLHEFLHHVQKSGVLAHSIFSEIDLAIDEGSRKFPAGSILIGAEQSHYDQETLYTLLDSISKLSGVEVFVLKSGNGTNSMTLGHPKVIALEQPSVAMVVGQGISPQSAGEVWHHIDINLKMPVTKIENTRFRQVNISKYNTIVLPDGNYRSWNESDIQKLKDWVSAGNRLILIGRAAAWAAGQKLIKLNEKISVASTGHSLGVYEAYSRENAAKVLGGSVLQAVVDLSNPMFYGYTSDKIAFMHSGTSFFEPTENNFATPAKFAQDYLISGYIPAIAESRIGGSAVLTIHRIGDGKIAAFQDNPLFRGYWIGGQKVFNNALFFLKSIDANTIQP